LSQSVSIGPSDSFANRGEAADRCGMS
jgi:hypothetical protein